MGCLLGHVLALPCVFIRGGPCYSVVWWIWKFKVSCSGLCVRFSFTSACDVIYVHLWHALMYRYHVKLILSN